MKKLLKFSGVIAAAFAIVSFILLLASSPVVGNVAGVTITFSGTVGIFGNGTTTVGPITTNGNWSSVWTGVMAFVLILDALLILIAGIVLPLLKVKAIEESAGILNIAAIICLILAGIFIFLETPAFLSANGFSNESNYYSLGGGWIAAGVLAIVSGVVAALPAVADLVGKKK